MKIFPILFALSVAVFLPSCGLMQTATQVPKGLLQSVGRSVGVGLEQSEEIPLKEE